MSGRGDAVLISGRRQATARISSLLPADGPRGLALEGPPGRKPEAWLKVKCRPAAIHSSEETVRVLRVPLCNCAGRTVWPGHLLAGHLRMPELHGCGVEASAVSPPASVPCGGVWGSRKGGLRFAGAWALPVGAGGHSPPLLWGAAVLSRDTKAPSPMPCATVPHMPRFALKWVVPPSCFALV